MGKLKSVNWVLLVEFKEQEHTLALFYNNNMSTSCWWIPMNSHLLLLLSLIFKKTGGQPLWCHRGQWYLTDTSPGLVMTLSARCWLRLLRSRFCLLWTCGSSSKEFFHLSALLSLTVSRTGPAFRNKLRVSHTSVPQSHFANMQNQNLMKSCVVLFKCLATICTHNNLTNQTQQELGLILHLQFLSSSTQSEYI